MTSIPVQTVIVNSIFGNAVLAGVFLYLWRADRREGALGYWAAAYAASACRVGFRLLGLEDYPAAIYGEALFGTLVVVLLWMGARTFIGKPLAAPWTTGLAATAGMGAVAGLAAYGVIPLIIPYLFGGVVYFLVGLALLRRGREQPGVGYGLAGFLFALFGGYVFVFSQTTVSFGDSRVYLFGPIINLLIGMVLLVVAQRKLQRAAEKANAALLQEMEGRQAAEDVVAESEQRYRAIVDTTRSMIGLLSPDGLLLDVNRAALERTDIRREQVIGKPLWETPWWSHDAAQQQRLRQAIRRVAAGGHDRFEATHPAPDGSLGYFNFFLTPIRDAAGQVVYLVPEAHDITARRQVEQTLHAAEQRFRAISEGSMLGVFVTDAAAQVTYFSRRATEITGISETEALAGRIAERIHPDDQEQHKRTWRAALVEHKPFVSERRHVRRDGSFAWSRIHVAPILDGNTLLGFVGTIEDINARKQSERALHESEERFSSFFALSPEPFAAARYPGGEYLQVNEAWERTFGYSQAEAFGRTALELGLWENPDDRGKLYGDIVRRNEARSGDIRMRRKNGDPILVQIAARVVSVGQNKYILWGTHDITERRRMEQALRESEDRFAKVFALGPEPMMVARHADAVCMDVNEAWLEKFRFGRDEVVGRTSRDFDFWQDFDERQKVIETLEGEGEVEGAEAWFKDRAGSRILAEVSARLLELAGERYVLWVLRDVTERRDAEIRLRISEEKFSKAFHNNPDYMTISRLEDGTLIDCNGAFERFTGYSRDEAIGRSTLDLGIWAHGEERARFTDVLQRQGWLRDFECTLHGRDGGVMTALLTASAIDLNDGRHYIIAVARDVSEQRRIQREIEELNMKLEARVQERTARLEKANAELGTALESLKLAQDELVRSEKLAALGSLVAGVSHELNTPIGNSVTVASTLNERTQAFDKAVAAGRLKRSTLDQYLEDARVASDLLLRNLTQASELVGSFKQVAVDQASAQRRRFNLRLVVEEVAATLAPMLKKTPFKLELDLADNIVMDSYPGPIGQVITNLVTNSLAHAFENRQNGTMKLKVWRRGLHLVEMAFADDGAGIAESDMAKLFDPFFTTKLGRGGSGLGLHIVYSLVTRLLGGRIQASSRPGVGTRFQISLPMKAPDKGRGEP
jgi:PAS domain S-box-containing protein